MSIDVILAIESAIGGGSLALAVDGGTVASWHGESGPARSEELLFHISELMKSASISVGDLSRIAVSKGPGSYTGIRIGLATALGLASSRKLPCIGISVLNSIARNSGGSLDPVVIVAVGRQNLCWQEFQHSDNALIPGQLFSGSLEDFRVRSESYRTREIVAHSDAYDLFTNAEGDDIQAGKLTNFGHDLAAAIANDARTVDEGLEPLYVREMNLSVPAGGTGAHK